MGGALNSQREALGTSQTSFGSFELCQLRSLLLGWMTFQALVIFSIGDQGKAELIGESHGRKD
jgi:hypothetical protein